MPVLSLGEFLWSLLVIFFMVVYFMMLIHVIADIFRRRDASGWTKALWLIFVFVAPFLGMLIYLIVNSTSMAERAAADARRQAVLTDEYARSVSGGGGAAAEIAQAKELLDNGTIGQQEFDQLKAKALQAT
jgi:Phospholipase_D-nuclease N-terminal/Short C-terminal domain